MKGLVASAPDGLAIAGWRSVITATIFAWLAPSVLGGVVILIQMAIGTADMGEARLMVWVAASLALVSPMLSWLAFVLIVPLVAALLRRGCFGWLPAMALGALAGAVLGLVADMVPLAMPFGAVALLLLRAMLGRLAPGAFALSRSDA